MQCKKAKNSVATFCNFSEPHFSVRALVLIGVLFHCKLVESFFDLSLGSIFRNSQDIIVVLLGEYQLRYHEDAYCKRDGGLRACHGSDVPCVEEREIE